MFQGMEERFKVMESQLDREKADRINLEKRLDTEKLDLRTELDEVSIEIFT